MAGKLQEITFRIAARNVLVRAFILKGIALLLLVFLAACTLLPDQNEPTEETAALPTAVEAAQSVEPASAVPQESVEGETDSTDKTAILEPTWTPEPIQTPLPTLTPSPTPTATPEPCITPGQIITGTYPSQNLMDGPERNYRVYLPPCYEDSNRVYPTVYLFHGNIGDDSVWDNLGLDEAAEDLIQTGVIPPLIIALPDGGFLGNNSSGGPNSFEGVILNEFIPYIEENFCTWPEPEGRAIGGLSRGGYWALEIAFRFPDHFISVGGHSVALLDSAAGPELNPQFTGLTNDLGDLRIYFDIGEDDYLLPNFQRLHEDMVTAERPHLWVLNEGIHEDGYWATHGPEYLQWYTEPWPFEDSAYPSC